MTKLTLQHIKKVIAADPRLDKQIDLDEAGKALVNTNDGWTWCQRDGNRHVEGFYISGNNADNEPQDTLEYFKERVSSIEVEA